MKVEFVMPLAANAHPPAGVVVADGGTAVPPLIVAQPGPSPGTGNEVGVVAGGITTPAEVAATANALEFRSSSSPRKFRMVNDGVSVQNFSGCRRPPICAPTANESWPLPNSPRDLELVPVTSLYSNCMNCRLTFFTTGTLSKSFENFSTKPSGLMSGSKVTEVRAQVKANLPAVAENHL